MVSVWRGFLFLWVLGMGYVILLWHSLSLHIIILPETKPKNIPDINHLQVNQQGVFKIMNNLNTSKAIGPDNIPNIILKDCAAELSPGLIKIFQLSLDSGTLPADKRNANISPVFKKGDRHLPENYRPVLLTSVPQGSHCILKLRVH